MDDLSFRRTVLADPNCQQPEVIAAAKQDPNKQAFWDELKRLDAKIANSLQVPVPDKLEEKLLLRQAIEANQERKRKRPFYYSLVASVLLVAIISYGTWYTPQASIEQAVLAHVSHAYMNKETKGLSTAVSLDDANRKLALFNGQLSSELGEILSVNYCYLNQIKSLHLIIKNGAEQLNLFVMPSALGQEVNNAFKDESNTAVAFTLESAQVILVGKQQQSLDMLASETKRLLKISA